jgi:hypothetical protein
VFEVYEQSKVQARCPQVGQHLRLENRVEMLHALHFDNDLLLDDEVDLVLTHPMAFVLDGHGNLALERDVLLEEFNRECFLVRCLAQLGSKDPMDRDGTFVP